MERTLICIGGGELKSKTTLAIDGYCAALAYRHAADHRPTALFVGTASHDSKPYFNTFRKTYTTVFDIKADLVLTVRGGEMDEQKLRDKFDAADLHWRWRYRLYVGGVAPYGFGQTHQSRLPTLRAHRGSVRRGNLLVPKNVYRLGHCVGCGRRVPYPQRSGHPQRADDATLQPPPRV